MSTVNIETHSSNFKVEITRETTVEDLIIEICKILKIGPVARHLFALRIKSTAVWFPLNAIIKQIPYVEDLEFRMRFGVPDVDRLRAIDANAYEFYFNQVKYGILHAEFPKNIYENHINKLVGLSVLDMFRAIVEDGLKKEDVIKDWKKYIPSAMRGLKRFLFKKAVINLSNELIHKNLKYKCDTLFVKSYYLQKFKEIIPNYLSVKVRAFTDDVDKPCAVQIAVNPYHTVRPGISVKYEHEEEFTHVCSINELCYVSIRKEGIGAVEITHKNGIPLKLRFPSITDEMSFVSLLDGYYRLMVNWIFNLCRELPTPSLQKLQPLKCHGPMSGKIAYRKLEDKCNCKIGAFLLRESDQEIDSYYIDVCTEASPTPVTLKIEMTSNKKYKLIGNNETTTTYTSIPALIAAHSAESADFMLRECLPPSEFDQLGLIFQNENFAHIQESLPKRESSMTNLPYIDSKMLMVFKNEPVKGKNQFTSVYRAIWSSENVEKNVVMKVLEESYKEKYLQEKAGFVHGNIRCRKVLVFSHTSNAFIVKLSHPGLHESYTVEEFHWIPPEHHNSTINEAHNSVMADVWAFGTTLWEIFSYGKSPPVAEENYMKEFYKSGRMLPQPSRCPDAIYYLMRECWNTDAGLRKTPMAIMRDINQIFYQVYNARQKHSCSSIDPPRGNPPRGGQGQQKGRLYEAVKQWISLAHLAS